MFIIHIFINYLVLTRENNDNDIQNSFHLDRALRTEQRCPYTSRIFKVTDRKSSDQPKQNLQNK